MLSSFSGTHDLLFDVFPNLRLEVTRCLNLLFCADTIHLYLGSLIVSMKIPA